MNSLLNAGVLAKAEARRLPSLGAVLVGGPEGHTFLQGQLSADIASFEPGQIALASCNSAQGRVQAVLWLVARSDGVALVMPRSIVAATLARLRKYVLRSKVTFSAPDRLTVATAPAGIDDTSSIRLPGHERTLVLTENNVADGDPAIDAAWRLEDIRAGLPQIYPATHEAFVAQMLNLDLLGGISFEKGCYTGQEIIARTHYRGAIKRRMFRFASDGNAPEPGTRILAGEQHAGDVVDAAMTARGCELLAVVSLVQKDEVLELESRRGAPLRMLELPYAVTS